MNRLINGLFVGAVLLGFIAQLAHAQTAVSFDPSNYAALASADSKATIPVGTKITLQNWQQYRQFLPPEVQWALEKKVPWPPVPSDWEVEIGPDVQVRTPTPYQEATEQHSGQVRLVKASTGGWALENYLAGVPFPKIDPADHQAGIKILYNNYYKYYPWCAWAQQHFTGFDRFNNKTTGGSQAVYQRVKHVADAGVPMDRKIGDNFDFTEWAQRLIPEQSKYTTQLSIFYDDPSRVEERYLFVPALRRVLRLSSSSRCAPFQGTDFTNEDAKFGFNGLPPYFQVTYLGEKRVIAVRNLDVEEETKPENTWWPIAWPKPAAAKWTPHDFYVIDATRLPAYATGYCFSHRVMFVDPETWSLFWVADYDQGGKLWKVRGIGFKPTKLPNGEGEYEGWIGNLFTFGWDVQVMHTTANWMSEPRVNQQCGRWSDPNDYALPGGLTQVER